MIMHNAFIPKGVVNAWVLKNVNVMISLVFIISLSEIWAPEIRNKISV